MRWKSWPGAGAPDRAPLAEPDAVPRPAALRHQPGDPAARARRGEREGGAPEQLAGRRAQDLADDGAVHHHLVRPQRDREPADPARRRSAAPPRRRGPRATRSAGTPVAAGSVRRSVERSASPVHSSRQRYRGEMPAVGRARSRPRRGTIAGTAARRRGTPRPRRRSARRRSNSRKRRSAPRCRSAPCRGCDRTASSPSGVSEPRPGVHLVGDAGVQIEAQSGAAAPRLRSA